MVDKLYRKTRTNHQPDAQPVLDRRPRAGSGVPDPGGSGAGDTLQGHPMIVAGED